MAWVVQVASSSELGSGGPRGEAPPGTGLEQTPVFSFILCSSWFLQIIFPNTIKSKQRSPSTQGKEAPWAREKREGSGKGGQLGGRRRGEAMRKEKRGKLEPVSSVSEHQDRQPSRAPGNEAQGGMAPLQPCPRRGWRATGEQWAFCKENAEASSVGNKVS